jgi:carboxymethylenebutenolidase
MQMLRPCAAALLLTLAACVGGSARAGVPAPAVPAADRVAALSPALPPAGSAAVERLAASPRHGEWARIDAGNGDSVRVWLVYPERADRAPVVLVVHEIFGLTPWVRSVADQLAADGFIAVAPDLLTGAGLHAGPDGPDPEAARAAIRTLDPADVQRRIDATARWAMDLPASLRRYAIIGYCWGGTVSFDHVARESGAATAVVFYGTSPQEEALRMVEVPVLGLYGENDARVNETIPRAVETLGAGGVAFRHELFEGAGHGFLRAQEGQEGANLAAAQRAWPITVEWLRAHLEDAR